MLRWPENRHVLAVACAAVICGGLLFPRSMKELAIGQSQSRESQEGATRAAIVSFNLAFNQHDADGLATLLTEDTVFEDSSPAPDGKRIEGKAAVAEFWRDWFACNPDAHFESEEVIVSGDRAVVRWVYRKTKNGQPWHLRGVDIFTVRDGLVSANLAYVKG